MRCGVVAGRGGLRLRQSSAPARGGSSRRKSTGARASLFSASQSLDSGDFKSCVVKIRFFQIAVRIADGRGVCFDAEDSCEALRKGSVKSPAPQ